MSLHSDLLLQAVGLVSREPRKPKQASLRRAVSAGYYALFHLLTHEASRMIVRNNKPLGQLLRRAFTHAEMLNASKAFIAGRLPPKIAAVMAGRSSMPQEVQDIASAFVDLQQARLEADYDVSRTFSRSEARALVDQAQRAFQTWQAIRNDGYAKFYLTCLFVWNRVK